MKEKWTEFKSGIKSFYLDDYILHIIPTTNPHGNNDDYFIVINDDAYFNETGKSKILTTKEINKLYNIDLDENN